MPLLPPHPTHVALCAAFNAAGCNLSAMAGLHQRLRCAPLTWLVDSLLATGFPHARQMAGGRLLAKVRRRRRGNPQAQAALGISARELEVLHEIAAGRFQQGDRGALLHVSPNTVKTHVARLVGLGPSAARRPCDGRGNWV